MSSGFATPITVKDTIDYIDEGIYLLPAIQRKFVWSSDQIEVLFDSIMRGYPINTFFKYFYTFLKPIFYYILIIMTNCLLPIYVNFFIFAGIFKFSIFLCSLYNAH